MGFLTVWACFKIWMATTKGWKRSIWTAWHFSNQFGCIPVNSSFISWSSSYGAIASHIFPCHLIAIALVDPSYFSYSDSVVFYSMLKVFSISCIVMHTVNIYIYIYMRWRMYAYADTSLLVFHLQMYTYKFSTDRIIHYSPCIPRYPIGTVLILEG